MTRITVPIIGTGTQEDPFRPDVPGGNQFAWGVVVEREGEMDVAVQATEAELAAAAAADE